MCLYLRRLGFTLLELLVVLTLITVLIALLTPAISQSIYQAELAVCASQLHTIGIGTLAYATENRRYYPQRETSPGFQPATIRYLLPDEGLDIDNRPSLRKAFNLKALNDPLTKSVDLSSDPDLLTAPTSRLIFSPYNLWMSWAFDDAPAQMVRIGDRFQWGPDRFSLLASDRDVILAGSPDNLTAHMSTSSAMFEAQSSHPDYSARLSQLHKQDEDTPWTRLAAQTSSNASANTAVDAKVTVSLWWLKGSTQRGLVDDNFLYDDLFVMRVKGVKPVTNEQRMARVPMWRGDPYAGTWNFVPKQRPFY